MGNPYKDLSDSMELIYDGISIANKGLLRNPDTTQRRKLNRRIARLEAELAEIGAKMTAIEDGETGIRGPTNAQVKLVAKLTGEVENMTRANITASKALALTSKIMDVAMKVADV